MKVKPRNKEVDHLCLPSASLNQLDKHTSGFLTMHHKMIATTTKRLHRKILPWQQARFCPLHFIMQVGWEKILNNKNDVFSN